MLPAGNILNTGSDIKTGKVPVSSSRIFSFDGWVIRPGIERESLETEIDQDQVDKEISVAKKYRR